MFKYLKFLYPIIAIFWTISIWISLFVLPNSILWIILFTFLTGFMIFGWYSQFKFRIIRINLVQSFLDILFISLITYQVIRPGWSLLTNSDHIPLTILLWFIFILAGICVLYNIIFIFLITLKGEQKAQESFIGEQFKQAQKDILKQQRENIKNPRYGNEISISSIHENVVFVQLDKSNINSNSNYLKSICNKNVIEDKLAHAEYLISTNEYQIINIYKFKDHPYIEISKDNKEMLEKKLNIVGLEIGNVIFNVSKNSVLKEDLKNTLNKYLDVSNKLEIFYNF